MTADFRHLLSDFLPRILSQCCRDPNSPAFGCFDRNFWHYRMRDFASIILQQGGYTVLQAQRALPGGPLTESFARSIAAGACRFWDQRASRHGAFEEYYPWEQGYPPLAFSSLAVAKMVAAGVCAAGDVDRGLRKAARQLAARFEPKAANQQVAGLAALAWIRKIRPDLVPDRAFARQKKRTLALQTEEGWYWEYDGPDAGYLSVTIDCLWDLFDATGDADFRTSADRALAFLHRVIAVPGRAPGMLNARNTDYVVPYGIARYLNNGTDIQRRLAGQLLAALYADLPSPAHFFRAVDDRYLCHYIGHSIARAILELEKAERSAPDSAAPEAPAREAFDLPLAGYAFRPGSNGAPDLFLALKKGGCLRVCAGDATALDFGWIVKTCKKQFVSHWWSRDWSVSSADGTWTIRGLLAPHRELDSTPLKHFGLRVVSFLFGRSVIGILKNVLIFKKKKSPYTFRRTISIANGTIRIDDRIDGLTDAETVVPAPRASKRHVASADSFHPEDVSLYIFGLDIQRTMRIKGDAFVASTVFSAGH